MLALIFAMLPFYELGRLSLVCKRWHSAASDPSWKPELVAYAWGAADVNGLGQAGHCPKPTLLPFSLSKPVWKLVCADAATLALTLDGDVYHWCARVALGARPASLFPRPFRPAPSIPPCSSRPVPAPLLIFPLRLILAAPPASAPPAPACTATHTPRWHACHARLHHAALTASRCHRFMPFPLASQGTLVA